MRPAPEDVRLYKSALGNVTTVAMGSLLATWNQTDTEDVEQVKANLMDTVPYLAAGFALAAAAVAADWYDLQRHNAGVKKRFEALMPPEPTTKRSEILVRWAVGPYFTDQAADKAAPLTLSKLAGGLQRLIQDGARETILGSTAKDPAKPGWTRETDGHACDFCQLLSTRTNYHSEETAGFLTHDKCGCVAAPLWA